MIKRESERARVSESYVVNNVYMRTEWRGSSLWAGVERWNNFPLDVIT